MRKQTSRRVMCTTFLLAILTAGLAITPGERHALLARSDPPHPERTKIVGDADVHPPSVQDITSKQPLWQQFPILIINIQPQDLDAHKGEIPLRELVDVVTYYHHFAPFDDDLQALGFTRATDLMDAAQANNLKVAVFLPVLADKAYPGNGIFAVCPDGTAPGCLYDATGTVLIPTNADDITPEYGDYWAEKVENFLHALIAYDTSNAIVAWYGHEEIRWWGPEYRLQVALREQIRLHDPLQRPLIAYSPHHYMAGQGLLYTLLQPATAASDNFMTVGLFPIDPVSFVVKEDPITHAVEISDVYPHFLQFDRDANDFLRPLQTHIIQGNYMGRVLGDYGHTNRIASLHRLKVEREAIGNAAVAYGQNNSLAGVAQPVPHHQAFHAPDLSRTGPQAMTIPEARHDFWSGLHLGQGIFIYNYRYRDETAAHEAVWAVYAEGLALIKQTLRQFLVHGKQTFPVQFNAHPELLAVIPGDDYLTNGPESLKPHWHWLAMPDYHALNGSLFEIGNIGYLIVTHSYDQEIDYSMTFEQPICSAQVVVGTSGTLNINGRMLHDSFDGIDARVYRMQFSGHRFTPVCSVTFR